ncbi:MAG TPA: hypothetical protein VHK69_05950, partial [Chitinophagaceae bacterium]|nr:hypothetical protein [Chitinophagaceae bacterium]
NKLNPCHVRMHMKHLLYSLSCLYTYYLHAMSGLNGNAASGSEGKESGVEFSTQVSKDMVPKGICNMHH